MRSNSASADERFAGNFGLDGIQNGTELTQIGSRLTASTHTERMTVSVGTQRSDFAFSLCYLGYQTPMRLNRASADERLARIFGLDGIQNGTQPTQIGSRLTSRTHTERMTVSVGTQRSDFAFSLC